MNLSARAVAHKVAGKTADGEDVSGSINVPEVAHDTELEEYVVRPLQLILLTMGDMLTGSCPV